VLSRITKPTVGEVRLRGRVGCLLEVGTGFHPELTGRENIFLNGAILGMRRDEIQRKFDQIVEFAEIGPFLDTPVKRYSSGMYVRLAFAVAAHLEPEILIVDEVLAVGDMAFQRKCLGRMREVGRSGSTILFVSHNMPAVESLCSRAILLDKGRVVHDGGVRELIAEYHRRVLDTQGETGANLDEVDGPQRLQKILRSCALLDENGEPTNFIPLGGAFHLRIGVDALHSLEFPTILIGIDDGMGQRLLSLQTPLSKPVIDTLSGKGVIDCKVAQFPLAPGDYWVKLVVHVVPDEVDSVERVLRFTVTEAEAFGTGRGFHAGMCVAPTHWTYQKTGVG
jgi:lipopolysaccharide transport system ATP-binding protein